MTALAPRIRVAVVDDQRLFAHGMQMLIESQPDLEFVGSAANGQQGIELVEKSQPDVVLMDIRMPVMDGIEATSRLTGGDGDGVGVGVGDSARPRVIILTTFQRDEAVFRAIRSGASGYITKDATPEFVLDAIRTVHAGHSVLAPKATLDLVKEFATPKPSAGHTREQAIASLSSREQEIFLLAARGLSNVDIAATAFISEATTKTHIRSILSKLGLRSRVQIVVFAYENGLLKY